MQTLINIIIIVFGILQIILFFKIWGMTNDIRKIREKYFLSSDSKKSIESTQQTEFNIGELVIEIKTNKQMRINEITKDGKYSCYTNGGVSHEGDFTGSEIKRFNS
ncbi:hypothetical protein [Bacteroides bouchesdurhonensis]|uniref:hypothetical protein n=1 Tax=Bacteroides bouchesdurhonensis TaxID=1841855 RepID=UPI00097F7F6A|nr:hypothetical protein [Bacteroides bouchesdurhonensis]